MCRNFVARQIQMPVPSQDHCGFPVSRLLADFVCLLIYEFWISLWEIALCSVILLLPLYAKVFEIAPFLYQKQIQLVICHESYTVYVKSISSLYYNYMVSYCV